MKQMFESSIIVVRSNKKFFRKFVLQKYELFLNRCMICSIKIPLTSPIVHGEVVLLSAAIDVRLRAYHRWHDMAA